MFWRFFDIYKIHVNRNALAKFEHLLHSWLVTIRDSTWIFTMRSSRQISCLVWETSHIFQPSQKECTSFVSVVLLMKNITRVPRGGENSSTFLIRSSQTDYLIDNLVSDSASLKSLKIRLFFESLSKIIAMTNLQNQSICIDAFQKLQRIILLTLSQIVWTAFAVFVRSSYTTRRII